MEPNESLMRQSISQFETDDIRVNRYTRRHCFFYISSLLLFSTVTLLSTLYLQRDKCNDESIFCPHYDTLLTSSNSI